MKISKKVQRNYEETIQVGLTCDLCKKESTGTDWSKEYYEECETVIKYRQGINYGMDGGYGTETTVDICPDCFASKLIPWLELQGVKPEAKKWDY
jgi:hypothetical protein